MMLKGQQPGAPFAHPTQGNSSTPPSDIEADAICGVVHDPVKSNPPVNLATAPPVANVSADTTFVTVTAAAIVNVVAILKLVVAVAVDFPKTVDERGEHPRKSGMLTL